MITEEKFDATSTTTDYFEVFSLPRKLTIDTAALEKQFYSLSRKYHPDHFGQANAAEQATSLVKASLLNDAYRTLKNPVSRIEHLLELLGVRVNENNAAKKQDASRIPADLLEEVFELNLQLEEMRLNTRVGEADPQLRSDLEMAQTHFNAQLAQVDDELHKLGNAWDLALECGDETAKAAIPKDLAALLDRRGYLRNLVRDVNETLEPSRSRNV